MMNELCFYLVLSILLSFVLFVFLFVLFILEQITDRLFLSYKLKIGRAFKQMNCPTSRFYKWITTCRILLGLNSQFSISCSNSFLIKIYSPSVSFVITFLLQFDWSTLFITKSGSMVNNRLTCKPSPAADFLYSQGSIQDTLVFLLCASNSF